MDEPAGGEAKEDLRAVVDWTVLQFFIFASVLANFMYQVFLKETVGAAALLTIKITDALGFEVHFIRFLYWTLFDPQTQPAGSNGGVAIYVETVQ